MDVKICNKNDKIPINSSSSFMKEIFTVRLYTRSVRKQYKINFNIPRRRLVVFGTKSLRSLASKLWNNMPYPKT